MAWTTPRTWAANELVTADLLNTHLRDNLNALLAELTPPGTLIPFAGVLNPPTVPVPTGWLQCDGSPVSRTTYANLFNAIGTNYGAGDGSTTFNLPDLRGRFPLGKDNQGGTSANRVTAAAADILGGSGGAETHTLTVAEMPAHTHLRNSNGYSETVVTTNANNSTGLWGGSGSANTYSQTGSQGSGTAHNNLSPYITVNYLIKI